MKQKQRLISIVTVLILGIFLTLIFSVNPKFENKVSAKDSKMQMSLVVVRPDLENLNNNEDEFDQDAALAKLREQIKGKEKELAENVFKNIQILKGRPAGQVLAIMQMGFSRSLGVNCTYCHTFEDWSNEDKFKKQIAREMWAMQLNINNQMLKNIKNLSERAVINCTTCHRGQTVPAINFPTPSSKQYSKIVKTT